MWVQTGHLTMRSKPIHYRVFILHIQVQPVQESGAADPYNSSSVDYVMKGVQRDMVEIVGQTGEFDPVLALAHGLQPHFVKELPYQCDCMIV